MTFYRLLSIVMMFLALLGMSATYATGQGAPVAPAAPSAPDNTAFTFQGSLANSGAPVSAACDFTFALYPSVSGGSRQGEIVTAPGLAVAQGFFQTTLDFGYLPLNGEERWIEINTRCPAGSGAFVTLTPRQRVQSAPYALTAMTGRDGFTVHGELWVNGIAIVGAPGNVGAISLRAPDLYLNADPSFGRGDGGRALVHAGNDVLDINHAGDFSGVYLTGPLVISGATTINGPDLVLGGNDLEIYGDANRGDGGRALVHSFGDSLYLNYGEDFSGGTVLDSNVRVIKDFQVEGNTIRLLGNDFYLAGDSDRGDGGRALVHTISDTLSINYEGDFAGGVHIAGLRTGGIVETNLMTTADHQAGFRQGDVLCWDGAAQVLAHCTAAGSPLVIAVADAQGMPLVFGAEPINVVGPVQPGDLLVAAATPGDAAAWTQVGVGNPPPGIIIAKALAPNASGRGQIMAFIMVQ
jgi:hypothetical protein